MTGIASNKGPTVRDCRSFSLSWVMVYIFSDASQTLSDGL